ncbi:hypothetical protein CHS0354_022873 [Potamilus streckersoni]|uniref:Poly [ADP-ribose] polymerase 12 n=1 Tax=Potamilus streckersoni TaxID=2493646 RepID=A0AAE0VML9_9BIVA|nr:hypothetical protein CHS0354_022873 [Potamilus streckersoni]
MNPNQNWVWDSQQNRFFPVTAAGQANNTLQRHGDVFGGGYTQSFQGNGGGNRGGNRGGHLSQRAGQANIPLQPHGDMFGEGYPQSFQGNGGGNRGGHLSQRGNSSQGQGRGAHRGARDEDNLDRWGGNGSSHHYGTHHGSMNSLLGFPPDIRSSVPRNLNFNPNQPRGRGTEIGSAKADNYRPENCMFGAPQTQDLSASRPLSVSGEKEVYGENKSRQNHRRGNFHGRRGRGRWGRRGQDRRRGRNIGAVGGERTTEFGSQCGSDEDDDTEEESSDFEQFGTDSSSEQGTVNNSIYGTNNTVDTMISNQTKDNTIAGAEGIKNLGLNTLCNRMRRYKAKLDALKSEGSKKSSNARALEKIEFFESAIEQIDAEIKSRSSNMNAEATFIERLERKPRKRRPRKTKSDYKNDRIAAAESSQPARDPTVSDSDDSASSSYSETEESFQQLSPKNIKSKNVEDLLSKIKDLGDQSGELNNSKSSLQDSIPHSSDTTKGHQAKTPGFRTSTGSLSKEKTPRRKSTQEDSNESECGELANLPNENKVFEYFIKEVGGPTSLRNIADKNLFPKDFDISKWFLSHQRRFILFKTDEKIHFIVPFYKEATFCLDYNGLGKFKTCEKSNCPHAHVCKDFIGGSCKEGQKCRFSHNFNDRANAVLISQLGLDIFSNEEIRMIYSQRFPHVCGSHNLKHICRRPVCAYIHICKRSLWGRCEKGSDCTLSHSLETEQNKNVLKAYHLSHWNEPLLRKVIFIYTSASKGNVQQKDSSPYGSKESIPEKKSMSQNMLNRLTDSRSSFQKEQKSKPDSGYKSSDHSKYYTRLSSSSSPERFGKHSAGRSGSFTKDSTNNDTEEAAKDSPGKRDFQQERKEGEDESVKYFPPSRRAGSQKPKSVSPDTDTAKLKGPKSRHGSSNEENKMSVDSILETDAAQSTPICDRYLVDKCKMVTCKCHHIDSIKLPYIWQIQMFNSWLTLDKLQMIEVERAYCNKESTCQAVVFYGGSNFIATLKFHMPESLSATVVSDGGKSSFKIETSVRRLSTRSYAEGTKPSSEDSFRTQWRWFFTDDFGRWGLLEPEFLQFTLEQKFTSKCQDTYLFCRNNYRFKYRIDFKSMEQKNMETGRDRKIMRRPLFVSAEDVESKNYPEKISTPTGVAMPLPKDWVPWDQAHDFELVELKQDSDELKRVERLFFSTLQPQELHISYIYRVQNMKLWRAYDEQKQSMKISLERAGQTKEVDERSLFHGTDSLNTVRGICTNSFDFRVCGKHGTVYGKGAYFARDAKYSHSYTNSSSTTSDRYMFLAKVLVGEYTTGSPSYTRPPDKPGATAHQLFDSCVDNVSNPSIFVVFDLKQCYPEYLVCYKNIEELSVREATIVRQNKNVTPYPKAQIQPSTLQNASVQPTSGIHKSSSLAETSRHRSAPTTSSFSDNNSSHPVSAPSYSPPLSPRRSSDATGSQTVYQRQSQGVDYVETRANQGRHPVRDPSAKQETCCLQ